MVATLRFLGEVEIEMLAAAAAAVVRDSGWYQAEVGKSE